ncbi:MAG: hypothetical protein ACK4N5_02220, partial [Myxococcales bacterium]
MRTLTAAQQKVLASPGYAVHTRVTVDDGTGAFRDLTNLSGYNFVEEVSLSEGIDQPVATAEVRLRREVHQLSLASLVAGSRLNHLTGTYLPLLALGRRLKVETATVPREASPGVGDWVLVFDGEVDELDPGASVISLSCRDLGARLLDRFIETERVYGLNLAFGVQRWRRQAAVLVGQRMMPTAQGSVQYRTCTVAGTTGANEPVWNNGGTTADGTAVWSAPLSGSAAGGPVQAQMQAVIEDNLGAGAVSLYTPASPAWNITGFLQRREPVLEAIRALALQIGWDLRYRWDSGTAAFRLTFWEPDRAKVTPDNVTSPITAAHYYDVRQLRSSRAGIRNVVKVIWQDPSDLDPEGQPKVKELVVSDAGSIAVHGRRYMEVQEAFSSRIDTLTEAQKLANNILSDLKDPSAEQQVDLPYWFPVELGDLLRFSANGVHYDSDQDLAVVAISHTLSMASCRTSLTCRGRPAAAYLRWHETDARPGVGQPGQDSPPQSAGDVTATAGINGATVRFKRPRTRFRNAELHISTSSGFTPSESTL